MPLRAQKGEQQKQNNKEHLQALIGTSDIYGIRVHIYEHGDIQPSDQILTCTHQGGRSQFLMFKANNVQMLISSL